MVCEEAELGPEEFAERMRFQHELHEQVGLVYIYSFNLKSNEDLIAKDL